MESLKSLVRSTGDVDLVVDVSNVCKSTPLGGSETRPAWSALLRVLSAWHRQFGSPRPVLACDRSLTFADHEQLEFAKAMRWGAAWQPWPLVLAELSEADPKVLEIAGKTGAAVLALDRYLDHRREHPWIQGDTKHFFGWEVEPESGRVTIVSRKMLVTGPYTMSEAEQEKEDQRRGLRGRSRDDALSWHYRCTNDRCEIRARFPERLRDLPRKRKGSLVCPGCGRAVEQTERRRPSQFIKLSAAAKATRLGLESGESIVLGRSDSAIALKRVLSGDDLKRVSGRQLRLSYDGRQVIVADLGSTNGTVLERWSQKTRERGKPQPLRAEQDVILRRNDRLTLAGVLQVAISGHRSSSGPRRGVASAATPKHESETAVAGEDSDFNP